MKRYKIKIIPTITNLGILMNKIYNKKKEPN